MKWYILQSVSGQERKVADAIREKADKEGLSEAVSEIIVPTETVIEIKKGKKVSVDKKVLPGYILIKMDMSDNLWHLIKKIPRVGEFLGSQGKPIEVSEKEINRITSQIENASIARSQALKFEVGESIKVNEGPFESFVGIIDSVDEAKQRVRVSVTIFGRSTPLDLEFSQVVKIEG